MRLVERWESFWFRPMPATDLAVCRILFYGFLVVHSWTFRGIFFTDPDLYRAYWIPNSFHDTFGLSRPGEWLGALSLVWTASLVLCCAGVFTRWSTKLAFALTLYCLSTPNQLGFASPEDAAAMLVTAALALSRCGDSYSVDAYLAARAGRPPPAESGEYTWPIQFGRMMLSLVLMSTAIAKLYRSGLEWVFSTNLAYSMLDQWYHEYDLQRRALGIPIARAMLKHVWLAYAGAGFAIVMELGHPLALFNRWARWIWVPGGFLLLMGIRNFLGFMFGGLVILHVFWVPWSRIGAELQARMRRR